MPRRKHLFGLLALTLAAYGAPAFAQVGGSLDLWQAWQKALQRDPIYAARQAAQRADQEVIPQARAGLLPQVTANALAQTEDTRRASTLSNSSNNNVALWALTLEQPLFNLERWKNLERAEFIAESADVSVTQSYQDLILRLSEAYFQVLATQDMLRALRAEKDAVEYQLRAARRGFELGSTTIADTYEAESRLDLLKANELAMENALQVSFDALSRIISERPAELASLKSGTSLPAPQPSRLDSWTARAGQANLDVLQAQLQAQIAQTRIEMAKSRNYPTVNLEAQTGSASDIGINYPNGGPRALDSAVGLRLSIPIFTGGEISSVIREETSRLQQARYELENARRVAIQDAQRYYSGVTSGLARIKALEAAEKSSLNSVQANQTGYEIGVRVNIDVLDAQRQLYETQRDLAQARYQTLMNSLRLKAAVGTLGEDDIQAVNTLLQ